MLSLNLRPVLVARGIDKPHAFLVRSGIHSSAAHNLLNDFTPNFKLAHIDRLCSILSCTPNDLLVWTPNPGEKLTDEHPLTGLKKQSTDLNWQNTIKTIPLNQLAQIVKLINAHKGTT
ncbi:MAG: helix-turn-helix transcriptional regulator [Bacteroidota bacterium]